MKNTQFHQTLFYKTEKGIHEKIIEFFSHGIRANERCVFLTTQSDAPQLLEHLKSNHDSSQVIKLFSYFNLPDPVSSPELFEEKMSRIREVVLNPSFEGIKDSSSEKVIFYIKNKERILISSDPEEIAEAAVWMCSDAASFVTGHTMTVDGGYVAQ